MRDSYAEGTPSKDLQSQALAGPERRGKTPNMSQVRPSLASRGLCLTLLPVSLSSQSSMVQGSLNCHWEAVSFTTKCPQEGSDTVPVPRELTVGWHMRAPTEAGKQTKVTKGDWLAGRG